MSGTSSKLFMYFQIAHHLIGYRLGDCSVLQRRALAVVSKLGFYA